MSAINWTSCKNAIHAWITSSSGLAPARVIYGGQNAVRPKGQDHAWVSLWIMGDERQDMQGAVEYFDNPAPTAGAELIKRVTGQSLVTVQITVFAPYDADDSTESYAILSDVVADTSLSEVTDPLSDAGVAIQQFGAITTVGGTVNTVRIEPRSQVTFTFLTTTVRERTLTFIETVNTEVHLTVDAGVKAYDFQFTLDD